MREHQKHRLDSEVIVKLDGKLFMKHLRCSSSNNNNKSLENFNSIYIVDYRIVYMCTHVT